MAKCSRRKRLTKKKGERKRLSHPNDQSRPHEHEEDSNTHAVTSSSLVENPDVCGESSDSQTSPSSQALTVHDYPQPHQVPSSDGTQTRTQDKISSAPPCVVEEIPLQDLLMEVKEKLEFFLHHRWLAIVDKDVLHVVYASIQKCVTVQRSLVISPKGTVELFVHSQSVSVEPYVTNLDPPLLLDVGTLNSYVDRIVSIVNKVRKMEVCSGYDDERYRAAWSTCPLGEIDRNPFQECRFIETFRSSFCQRLVNANKWRCSECLKLYGPLKRRAKAAAEEEHHVKTPNKFLTEKQMLNKLEKQRTELDNAKKKIYRLQARMQEVIQKESVQVDQLLADDLSEILSKCEISPAQSIFLQQQVKASQQRNACGMRWHPTMIRFALALHLTSPTAYDMVRQTGIVKLPSSSTLFDYSHAEPVENGVDKVVLESLSERVSEFKEKHKKFHVLMADEMYISQNLVFQKSTGKLHGYTSLDLIDKEVKNLEQWIDDPDKEVEEIVASKVLVYMVKGVTNGIKEVVATFAVGDLSANQLYIWTWKVIGALERSGIAVVAFVSDGSSVNRAFIKKHKPATLHESGLIFDAWNKAARGRKLYFIADVPHLLKMTRNCLLNSRWDGKKSRRKMMKNGKRISWDFIIKLYEMKKGKNLRKSCKLNAMNVYPDSYARMKVKLAAQPVSNTVSTDMHSQGWEDATETVSFIKKVNDWFDCLNGAHSSQAQRTNNINLAPYTSKDDPRFKLLDDFLQYLDDWEREAQNPHQSVNTTIAANNSKNVVSPDGDESEIEDRCFNAEEDTRTSKRILSRQTLDGIRTTTLAFKPLVEFLLQEQASFINARIFCQDPLEQHFSKIRAGHGGSNNPNVMQVFNRNRALHTVGQLGMGKRKGNSGEGGNTVEVTTEPLPKRKWKHMPKFS